MDTGSLPHLDVSQDVAMPGMGKGWWVSPLLVGALHWLACLGLHAKWRDSVLCVHVCRSMHG